MMEDATRDYQAAEIQRLRAENAKTKLFYIEAGLELRQLREDNKRLRAALKPFADLSSHWEGDKMPLEPKTIIIDPLPVLYAVKETRND